MKHVVVGTAGHVDHGKTALVKALTGIDTDSLQEEKQRGLTIQPGFAPYSLPSGQNMAFIDVPGHERFIKNMLRGICGIDVAMLVVAADDGVMPQTREHLDILKLLGIRQGLVVLSKVDLVDQELIAMAMDEINDLTRGSFLEGAPCVPFSVRTLEGKAEIETALETLGETSLTKDPEGVFCLPIDRVFHMRGFGTVVTGTMASGKIGKEDEIEIYPSSIRDRVRSIQVYRKKVNEAYAGERVALNLPQVGLSDICRGMVVGEPGSLMSSHFLNARFYYLASQTKPLQNRTRIRFHTGASETNALMVFMDKDVVRPGESAFVQFRLLDRLTPLPFDRYIVRTLSPVTTIGGGTVLEIARRKFRRGGGANVQYLRLIMDGADDEVIENVIKEETCCPICIKTLSSKTGVSRKRIEKILTSLEEKCRIVSLGNDQFFHREKYDAMKIQMVNVIKQFHETNPLERGIPKEDMRSSYFRHIDIGVFEHLIEELLKEDVIFTNKGIVRLADFQAHLSPTQEIVRSAIEEFATQKQNAVFTMNALLIAMNHADPREVHNVVSFLTKVEDLIFVRNPRLSKRHPLQKGAYMHRKNLEGIKNIVGGYVAKHGQISIVDLKELAGINCSRAATLLDYLDSIQYTVPVGDSRILRGHSSNPTPAPHFS